LQTVVASTMMKYICISYCINDYYLIYPAHLEQVKIVAQVLTSRKEGLLLKLVNNNQKYIFIHKAEIVVYVCMYKNVFLIHTHTHTHTHTHIYIYIYIGGVLYTQERLWLLTRSRNI
jgi:hypothetical protein